MSVLSTKYVKEPGGSLELRIFLYLVINKNIKTTNPDIISKSVSLYMYMYTVTTKCKDS